MFHAQRGGFEEYGFFELHLGFVELQGSAFADATTSAD